MRSFAPPLFAAVLAAAAPFAARAADWTLTPATEGQPARLTYDGFAGKGVRYAFACQPGGLSATETGVTGLLDPTTGAKIGDDKGGAITAEAAAMALYTDKVQPTLAPAAAKPNAVHGWDLSISLKLGDAVVKSWPHAGVMSLMTTGWTGQVQLSPDDRKTIAAFLAACGR